MASIVGHEHALYAQILFIIFAAICGLLCCIQLIFLQKLQILAIYLLPMLSFFMCFENVLLFCGTTIQPASSLASTTYTFQALEIPLFVLIMSETTFRLHEARSAQLCCVRFDQGEIATHYSALFFIWLTRVIAAGLFVINILVNFSFVPNPSQLEAGNGGYPYLAEHSSSLILWLALIPPIVLSLIALLLSLVLYRFGNNLTLGLKHNSRWSFLLVFALGQLVGQCFGLNVYPVTSNAGELALLIGVSILVYLVQEDLALAGSYADFLHRNNLAFQKPASVSLTTPEAQAAQSLGTAISTVNIDKFVAIEDGQGQTEANLSKKMFMVRSNSNGSSSPGLEAISTAQISIEMTGSSQPVSVNPGPASASASAAAGNASSDEEAKAGVSDTDSHSVEVEPQSQSAAFSDTQQPVSSFWSFFWPQQQ